VLRGYLRREQFEPVRLPYAGSAETGFLIREVAAKMRRSVCVSWMATILATALPGSFSAHAAGACRETICAEQGWTRATPRDAQTAAIYFSIVNEGAAADILVKASTPVAASAMFHRTTMTKSIA